MRPSPAAPLPLFPSQRLNRAWCDWLRTDRRLSGHCTFGVRRALVNAGMLGLLGGWVGKNIGLL